MGSCKSKAKNNVHEESQKEARLRQKRENKYREELRLLELNAFRRLTELEQRQKDVERQEHLDRSGDLNEKLSNLHIREEPFVEEVKRDPQLIKSLLLCVGQSGWTDKVDGGSVFVWKTIQRNSQEFNQQNNLFRKTNKKYFKIRDIQKVFNPYLFLQYKLKEKQYRKRLSVVQIKKMYHGTKLANVNDISKTNFDWRRNGNSTGHRFGQGVSFSPYSNYATHYGDKKSFSKVMFAVDILVGETCLGEGNTIIPEGSADTTVNDKGSVYVKYEDNAFYPTQGGYRYGETTLQLFFVKTCRPV